MTYRYQLVERIPAQLCEGVVYHTEEFELAGLLCACGCGHRITLLVPDGHEVLDEGGFATVRPSIGVLDGACKSHYFIRGGRVEWLAPFTGAQASMVMRAQIARHVYCDAKPKSRWSKCKTAVVELLRKVFALVSGKWR